MILGKLIKVHTKYSLLSIEYRVQKWPFSVCRAKTTLYKKFWTWFELLKGETGRTRTVYKGVAGSRLNPKVCEQWLPKPK